MEGKSYYILIFSYPVMLAYGYVKSILSGKQSTIDCGHSEVGDKKNLYYCISISL